MDRIIEYKKGYVSYSTESKKKHLAHIDTPFKVFQLHIGIYTPPLGLIAC